MGLSASTDSGIINLSLHDIQLYISTLCQNRNRMEVLYWYLEPVNPNKVKKLWILIAGTR